MRERIGKWLCSNGFHKWRFYRVVFRANDTGYGKTATRLEVCCRDGCDAQREYWPWG